jgi:hypothetical protein
MNKLIYFDSVGCPTHTASYSDDAVALLMSQEGNGFLLDDPLLSDEIALSIFYLKDGEIRVRPAQPSEFYRWDSDVESWVFDWGGVRETLTKRINIEIGRRIYLPCNGFDADKTSRDRISGMIARLQRGDGLPTGWVGWRDAENGMHWETDDASTVLTNLTALSRAIEDREQALLVAGWTHKANIAALTDIDAIIAYDVTAGWPS